MSLLLLTLAPLASASTLRACDGTVDALPGGLDQVKDRVVRIETANGSGTGVLISPDGLLLTAAHVVGDAPTVAVRWVGGGEHEGTVLRRSFRADVALVQVPDRESPCLPVTMDPAATGADVFLMGSPGGEALTHSVTKGVVSGYRDIEGVDVLQTDAALSPGYSGGPVLSDTAALLGIISFKVVGEATEGIGFAITAEDALDALNVDLGEATDPEIPQQLEPIPSGMASGGSVEIVGRPASPAPPVEKKPCKKVNVEVGEDAFSGATVVSGFGADLFEFRYDADNGGIVTLFFPVRSGLSGINEEFGDATTYSVAPVVDLKLEDGTTITLHALGPAKHRVNGYTPWLVADFPLTRELAEALASSGPTLQRWTFSSKPRDFERSERQREKYFRPYFSCLLTHWPAE